MDEQQNRYRRQIGFQPIGADGQEKIGASTVTVCGCGALGSSAANLLVRAGVGAVRIIDRDFVDLSNLQRQSLFDETDVLKNTPKAVAASEKLRKINSQVHIDGMVEDIHSGNIQQLLAGSDVVLDGTDNFQTRFLINDYSLKTKTPWVFAGCLGADGQTMPILPGSGPCLRCLMPQGPPPTAALPTCETGGILSTVIQTLVAIQISQVLRILVGKQNEIEPKLTIVDLWDIRFREMNLDGLKKSPCPGCSDDQFPWLDSDPTENVAVLCGRNSVQVSPAKPMGITLKELAENLRPLGHLQCNDFLLRLTVDSYTLSIFKDGRAIITGTEEPSVAKSLYAKYLGN